MSSYQFISLIITLTVTGFSFPFIFARIKTMSLNYHKLNLGHYEKMKALCGNDARNNLCELRVALAAFTNKKLLPVEIEWFVHTPGAFKHLKKFGKCHKYLEIDTKNNIFIWSEKFKNINNRRLERFKLFITYLLTSTIGIFILLSYKYIYGTVGFIPTMFIQLFALAFCLIALIFLWISNIISDSELLTKIEDL